MARSRKDHARIAEELRDHRLQRSAEFQYGFPLFVYGPDRKARAENKPDSEVHKYNGIVAVPRGFVAQFAMNYQLKGTTSPIPLILTVASQDPSNLGEYDEKTGKYYLSLRNILDRTYLVSARSPHAPLLEFQHDITNHFRIFQKYHHDLNLLGETSFFRYKDQNFFESVQSGVRKLMGKETEKESFYFGQYLSKHVTYAVVQVQGGDYPKYVVLKRYGPGKLDYDSNTYPIFNEGEINVRRLRRGIAPFDSEFINGVQEEGTTIKTRNGQEFSIFDNTMLANAAVIKDFNDCFTHLWNMHHASGQKWGSTKAFFMNAARTGKLGTALFRGGISAGSVQLASLALGGGDVPAAILSGTFAIAAGTDFTLGKFGDKISDFLSNGWRGNTERRAQRAMTENSLRSYTDEFVVASNLKIGRPLKKIDPEFAGKAVRLMAAHEEAGKATSLYLPIDPVVSLSPSDLETSPFTLFVANVTGGTAANLSRDLTPNISLGHTPTGMTAMSIVSDFNSVADLDGKPNIVTKYVRYVPYFQTKAKAYSDDVSAGEAAMQAHRSERVNGGIGVMEFRGIEGYLKGRTAQIVINRQESTFKIKFLEEDELKEHLTRIFRDNVPLNPAQEDRKFYGLGWEDEAFERLQDAFGIHEDNFAPAPQRQP